MFCPFFVFSSNDLQRFSLSQPDPTIEDNEFKLDDPQSGVNNNNALRRGDENTIAWSQPANIEDMLLSQISTTPGSSQVCICIISQRDLCLPSGQNRQK